MLVPIISYGSYSCENGFARKGDTKVDVKLKCGNPVDAEDLGIAKINGKYVYLDVWTYNPGKGKFYKVLEFHDGKLVQFKSGPRIE